MTCTHLKITNPRSKGLKERTPSVKVHLHKNSRKPKWIYSNRKHISGFLGQREGRGEAQEAFRGEGYVHYPDWVLVSQVYAHLTKFGREHNEECKSQQINSVRH